MPRPPITLGAGLCVPRGQSVPNLYALYDFRGWTSGRDLCDEENWEPAIAPWHSAANKTHVENNWDANGTRLEFGPGVNGTTAGAQFNPGGNFYVQSWGQVGAKPSTYWDAVRVWAWGVSDLGQSSDSLTIGVAFSDPLSTQVAMAIDRNSGSVWKGAAGGSMTAPTSTLGSGVFCAIMEYDVTAGTAKFCFQNATASADWTFSAYPTKTKTFTGVAAHELAGLILFSGSSAAGVRQQLYLLAVEFRARGGSFQHLIDTTTPPA